MNATKPIASLSLDLDNHWSYLKTHGDPSWKSLPSYLDVLVPRVLDFLKQRDLTITFFVVGQDAALPKNRELLASISAAGHEIGNHSFHHEPWLHLYSEPKIDAEIAQAEEQIEQATGKRPIGFRGPGYSFSPDTLEVLARRGYLYDASSLPTFLGPLARVYYFMTTKLSGEERQQRKILFGTLRDGLRRVRPYRWRFRGSELMEIPVTTIPILKLPFHPSYVLYLSGFSTSLALSYFRVAMQLCRVTNTRPSLLLHPLDFLGSDDIHDLGFFPGMQIPRMKKLAVLSEVFRLLAQEYKLTTMQEHARQEAAVPGLPVVEPSPVRRDTIGWRSETKPHES